MTKSKAPKHSGKARDLTITELAERMAALGRYMEEESIRECHDAAAAEQALLEDMILLRMANNLRECAIQLALVAGDVSSDWDWSPSAAVAS